MANTYEAIATVEVGSGGAANIEFTSIPGTYTDLVVYSFVFEIPLAVIDTLYNSTAAPLIYSDRYLYGTGTMQSVAIVLDSIEMIGMTKSDLAQQITFGNAIIYIPNYTSSNNKSISVDSVNENNDTEAYAMLTAGLWSNSAAITSIKLLPASASQLCRTLNRHLIRHQKLLRKENK
jgi:hypothetical protein